MPKSSSNSRWRTWKVFKKLQHFAIVHTIRLACQDHKPPLPLFQARAELHLVHSLDWTSVRYSNRQGQSRMACKVDGAAYLPLLTTSHEITSRRQLLHLTSITFTLTRSSRISYITRDLTPNLSSDDGRSPASACRGDWETGRHHFVLLPSKAYPSIVDGEKLAFQWSTCQLNQVGREHRADTCPSEQVSLISIVLYNIR